MDHRQAIIEALTLGIDVERGDPSMVGVVPNLTERQIEWVARWLASEGIGRLDK